MIERRWGAAGQTADRKVAKQERTTRASKGHSSTQANATLSEKCRHFAGSQGPNGGGRPTARAVETEAPTSLTSSEEVTLRRLALGLTPLRLLPEDHVRCLERLNLIEPGGDGYQLTPRGWTRYQELPRPQQLAPESPPAAAIEQMLLNVVDTLNNRQRNSRRRRRRG